MVPAVILGIGLGVGLWALVVWAVPPRPSLGMVLARAAAPPAPPPILLTAHTGWAAKLGRPFIASLRALGLPGVRLSRDLAVIGRPIATHLADKATLAMAGLLLPPVMQLLFTLAGQEWGFTFPVVAGLVLAVAGFVLPDVQARAEATKRRAEFRHALSSFLDLVWITLAGGAGVDSALNDSAGIGQGWAFSQIRRALDTARLTRTTPWSTLRQLGEELDVTELAELAASVSLAGTEGAKVRASLAAKAGALRTHQITDAEANAQSATERMSLPVMALFLGFLTFVTYPAVDQVLNGL
ncbi:type II secretion system F family protein [Kibdelosporangium philippinense]|uniref:Type II secretion system F family protein n=1 Tax=Kibdelosporangium philippinense TaxID=211113 RepID=A0ABS8ZSH8_9PSEU|nr:type II secretion system F family protein [Kibdelosporangium philippinense]MCE7009940.1 type II secretion system F family protein [Kibdelosporangium philippinense]